MLVMHYWECQDIIGGAESGPDGQIREVIGNHIIEDCRVDCEERGIVIEVSVT